MLRSELGSSLRGSIAQKGLLYIGRDWTLFLQVFKDRIQSIIRIQLEQFLGQQTEFLRSLYQRQ